MTWTRHLSDLQQNTCASLSEPFQWLKPEIDSPKLKSLPDDLRKIADQLIKAKFNV